MRAMKDSGIQWLGEYPATWSLKKIKYCLQERIEKNNPVRTTEILSLTAKQGVIPYDQKEGGGNKPKEDVSAYRLAYPGDIVMNSMNILSGSVGLSQYFGCVSPVYYMLRPWDTKEDVRYYNYIFQTTMFQRSLYGLGNGILIKESGNGKLNTIRMRIPMDKFGGLFIPVASPDEQSRIADFLDAKCTEIDALVADVQAQTDVLEQYKRSVITETVTKGLNPDAKMKDSGIQWIGMIPSHWECIRGKYILKYIQKPVREDDAVITCFRDGEVTLRSNRREDGFTMAEKEIGYQGIDVGDLVVHGMDGFAGAIGISDSRGKASPVLNVLETEQNKRYIMYFLRSMAYSDVFLALATGIRVRSCDLRWNKLAELFYPVPPIKEQDAIVAYQINKDIEEDPRCKTNAAKRQIARFVELHETNIAQRIEVIVEHFRTTVLHELGGQAKAMVITASRQGAVKYRQAFEEYISKKGYEGIHALVAFSGKVKLPDDEVEYTEASINGFPEDHLPREFDSDAYQVLLVANKYQTGFDQPKLCAMYVLKKLKGVNAVQTLSRLNRICAPYDKKTFVLDFVNTYEDIKAAFAPYYTTTLLANSVTPNAIYDLEAQIDAYAILDPADIESANEILYSEKVTGKQKQQLTFFLQKSKKLLEHYDCNTQREGVAAMRSFVRYYEFLLQVSSFEDHELHKKYNFVAYLLAYINIKHPGGGFNLDGKIKASNFVQKKGEEHTISNLVAKPVTKLPTAEHFGLTEDKEQRLSEIIDEINSRTGKSYDNDVAIKAMLQIRDILMKSDKLKTSAKNNTQKDFEFSYFDDIDDALIEGLSQNQDFFSMLLSNDEMKRQVLGIFSDEIYKSLRNMN